MARFRNLLLALVTVLVLSQPFKGLGPALAQGDEYEDDDELSVPDGAEDSSQEGSEDIDYGEGEGISEQDASYDDEEEEAESSSEVPEDDGDVVALTASTFKAAIKENKAILVEFYAPWCGHCKALVPEFRTAAAVLKEENVTLAKVDATRETTLAEDYGVDAFPTIYFFLDGHPRPFNGGRTSEEIVEWVRKKLGPSVETVDDRDAAEKVILEQQLIGIAYFDKLEGPDYENYQAIAAVDEGGVYFIQTTSPAIAEMFGINEAVKRPVFALLKDEEEKFTLHDGEFDLEKLNQFTSENKLPLVITFTEENSDKIFGTDIRKQLMLFVKDGEEYETYMKPFQEAAKAFRDRLIFVHINVSDTEQSGTILEFFSMDGSQPAVFGFVSEVAGRKYKMEGPLTLENIKAFGQDFVDNKAKPFLKSDAPPETNDGDVKIVVGTTFDEIVLDETKDVMLEVYAPWCGHCKKLAPIWEKLGKRFSSVESVVIAAMDGTTNEHLQVNVEGFPTILFWPADNKTEPIKVEGQRTLKPLTRFIKKHAAIPFTLPKRGDLRSPEEQAEEKMAQAGEEDELAAPAESQKDEL